MEVDQHFIRVYEDALREDVCKNTVRLFEEQIHEEIDDDGRPKFKQWNLTQFLDENSDEGHSKVHADYSIIQQCLIESCHHHVQQYMDDTDCRDFFPARSQMEQLRVKKYCKGTDDRFEMHVDVGDHQSARRFLAIQWYLNDVEEGGETEFRNGLQIKPKAGTLLIFPPLWTYPHKANPAVSHTKYIATPYTHYV